MADNAPAEAPPRDSNHSRNPFERFASICEVYLHHARIQHEPETAFRSLRPSSFSSGMSMSSLGEQRRGRRLAPSQVAAAQSLMAARRNTCDSCTVLGRSDSNADCESCLSMDLSPVNTMESHNASLNFAASSRRTRSDLSRLHHATIEGMTEARVNQLYERMKFWEGRSSSSMTSFLFSSILEANSTPKKLSHDEMLELAHLCYPPRAECDAFVFDIYQNHTQFYPVFVGSIESWWQSKPDDVIVRWIHVPFAPSLPHSSVEDLFLHAGEKGRDFRNSGSPGFPFLETDELHFRSRHTFEMMRDVFAKLSTDRDLLRDLSDSTWRNDSNESLKKDVIWRAGIVAASRDFWSICHADMPGQLSEVPWTPEKRFSDDVRDVTGPVEGLQYAGSDYRKQALSNHPFFKNSQLVKTPFRTFHSADGFLLTLSGAQGVNYLNKDYSENLKIPRKCIWANPEANCIARILDQFRDVGARNWHRQTVEWFTIYLVTEIGCSPNNRTHGGNAPDLPYAYESVVADLKRRRYQVGEVTKSSQLVREYLTCLDELNVLALIWNKKIQNFRGLVKDCQEMEEELKDVDPHNERGVKAVDRAEWAAKTAEETYGKIDSYIRDASQSLDALFQLSSIEQNERAIQIERLGKAVFVFTAVTSVFLPLSFFTSYYGMNLRGIFGTSKTEHFFWAVCGTSSLAIVLVTIAVAFRFEIKAMIKSLFMLRTEWRQSAEQWNKDRAKFDLLRQQWNRRKSSQREKERSPLVP